MENSIISPQIIVIKDYDDVFLNRVKSAIKLNIEQGRPMVEKIQINSGAYRPYCMSYNKDAQECRLDFYAANRVFGFEHTIQDIADSIVYMSDEEAKEIAEEQILDDFNTTLSEMYGEPQTF